MKTIASAIILLTVATSTLAAPSARRAASKRSGTCKLDTVTDPSSDDLFNSINSWNTDVGVVNSFLNDAASLLNGDINELVSRAQDAFFFASDEPCQLGTLSSRPSGAADFDCAVDNLGSIFDAQVLQPLQDIIGNPSDTGLVQEAVGGINVARCCNVLPDLDILWVEIARDAGFLGLAPQQPERPDACGSIDCSDFASTANCIQL